MNATAIEHKFKTKLASIAALRITAAEIKNNANLYDSLIMSAYYYFAEVVLRSRKNYSLINSTGIERDEFLDDVLMHFLSKLDAILACPKEQLIPFTVKLANNKVIDKVRSYQRLYPVIYKKMQFRTLPFPAAPVRKIMCSPSGSLISSTTLRGNTYATTVILNRNTKTEIRLCVFY